jgi:hypothetical protein
MGDVYLAEDKRLLRQVALKLMRSEYAAVPEYRQRFLREARLASKLKQDNVCPIYEIGHGEDGLFVVMTYLARMGDGATGGAAVICAHSMRERARRCQERITKKRKNENAKKPNRRKITRDGNGCTPDATPRIAFGVFDMSCCHGAISAHFFFGALY